MYRFPAEVHHSQARQLAAAAQAAQGGGARHYDLSACERFDSSLLAVLLELLRSGQAAGAAVRFEGVGAGLRRLAGLYGVEQLLFGDGAMAGAGGPAQAQAEMT